MPKPFRQQYTRPVPPGAERTTLKKKVRGKTVELPAVRFKGADGRPVVAPLTRDGDRCRVEAALFYGRVRRPDGTVDRVPLCEDRTQAETMLKALQLEADRAKALGVPLERLQARGRPLEEWLTEYEAAVRSGSRRRSRKDLARPSAGYVAQVMARARAVVAGTKARNPEDLTLSRVQEYLDGLRRGADAPALPAPAKGKPDGFRPSELAALLGVTREAVTGMARRAGIPFAGAGRARRMSRADAGRLLDLACRGDSDRTVSYYAREAKALSRWLVRRGALATDPLEDLPGARGTPSGRHERRALEEAEVRRLLDATRDGGATLRGLTPADRYHLYLTALSTGFRAGELASLTPASFLLDGEPPVVTLARARSKNRQGAAQPLPAGVVPALRAFLAGRPPGQPVWPGPWHEDAAAVVRADCTAAGVPTVVAGPDGELFFDFHGLRHSFVARLDRAGVPLKAASELARHSTVELTAKIYARPRLHDLAGLVDRLGADAPAFTPDGRPPAGPPEGAG